jgi:hypothetical protein
MNEETEISGKYLGTISADFIKVADTLREASYQIRKGGFDYPIFPICKEPQPVGNILLEKDLLGNSWHYYASFLDEFVQRELIDPSMQKAFTDSYKDPDEFCCLFVVDPEFTNFLYIPFPED